MNRDSYIDTWPTPAEANAMNAAAADAHSAVDAAATVLGNLQIELEDGNHRGEDGRRLILALVEICALGLRHIADGAADDVSHYAARLSDATSSAARKETSHADQP